MSARNAGAVVDTASLRFTLEETTHIVDAAVKSLGASLLKLRATAQGPTPRIGDALAAMPGFVYGGWQRGEDGAEGWHVAVLVDHAAAKISAIRGEWGNYGQTVKGAAHRRDGLANAQAMAKAGSAIAKAALDADVYIASLAEAQLISANLHELMPKGYHFTSTQYSPDGAWVQGFEDGYSDVNYKRNEFPAVVVRRFNPSDFGPSTEAA